MKKMIKNRISKIYFLFALLFTSLISMAQDKKIDIDINAKDSDSGFFMQPWVWVVGGAVFILLLIALLKNNNSK